MDNRTRSLAQAVSVDGWIGEFKEDGTASVHADIVFRKGVFGEDPNARIRFKIALKRAEIVLRIPDKEPVRVVRTSVRRVSNSASGKKTHSSNENSSLLAKARAKLSLNPTGSAEGEATYERGNRTEAFIEQEIGLYLEQHFTTPDGHFAWELQSSPEAGGKYLEGSPWDALDAPRLNIKHETGQNKSSSTLVVEVRCHRDDIEILDLEEKDTDGRLRFSAKRNRHVNLAAAEQLIKDELLRAGFMEIPDLSEKHSYLLIADKIILVD